MINPSPASLALAARIDQDRFAHKSLLVPLTKDRETQSIASSFFDQIKYLTLPAPVHVPTEDKDYKKACEFAFLSERMIHSLLVTDRGRLNDDQISKFDSQLLASPATRNLLSRMQMVRETERFMGAGIYLGTDSYDHTMQSVLLDSLDRAYRAADTISSNVIALRAACGLWGLHQPVARESILNATWEALVKNQQWSIPDGFRRNMARLLEHEFPPALRSQKAADLNSRYSLTTTEKDTFYDWFSHVELLRERHTTGRPAEQSIEIESTVTPRYIFREGQLIRGLSITNQQALDHWSLYASIPTLQWVEVSTPALQNPRNASNQQRARIEFIAGEIQALARTPLAPFISALRADISGATSGDALFLLNQWRKCLSTIARLDSWRDPSKAQTIRCILTDISPAVKKTILQIHSKPRSHDQIYLSEAKDFSSSSHNNSLVLSVTIGPRR